jgi:2-keto-3-deoxy-6-phosphogluconate aldolase
MKLAFMIMGRTGRAYMEDGVTSIVGVKSMDEACETAKKLAEEGIDAIEVCGAFKEEGTRKLIEATGGKIPIGYVVHFPEQDDLFKAVFKN